MMSDQEFDEEIAAIDKAIAAGKVRLKFWVCPVKHPWEASPRSGTVEWDGNVAYCLWPGCMRRSDDEVPRGICYCEEYVCHGECCGPDRCSCTPETPAAGGPREEEG